MQTYVSGTGHASGWSVAPNPLRGNFQWSTWGPWGGNLGHAPTREEAEEKARANVAGMNAVHAGRERQKGV